MTDSLEKSKFHELRPDYTMPAFAPRESCREAMRDKLVEIYGASAGKKTLIEIERLMAVYYAHKTQAMRDWERGFDPADRYTEKDAVLITYGDLIRDKDSRPLSALSELCEKYLKNVFNTLHILPFFPYSSDRGFAVINFLAVDPNLGSWEDLLRMNDNFKLMFDGVFNHISSRSRWFQEFLNRNPEFRDFFPSYSAQSHISKEKIRKLFRPRTSDVFTVFKTLKGERKVWTTFGPDQVDLNFKNPAVLLKIVEILLYYVRRGADSIRLDAVTYLWKELGTTGVHHRHTHLLIKLFRDILDSVAPHVALVTETNVPHAENISYFGDGHDEAQMVYNFALPPLILHTFLTGSSDRISCWAKTLGGVPAGGIFFNFLDSHDGIGLMGAKGILSDSEIDALVKRTTDSGGLVSCKSDSDGRESVYEMNITSFSFLSPDAKGEPVDVRVRRYLAARSIPLILVGVPGVYLHGLLGSENDIEAVRVTSIKRDINRKNLSKASLFETLDDRGSLPSKVSTGISIMLKLRQSDAAFHPHARQEIIDAGPSFFCLRRLGRDGSDIVAAVNVSGVAEDMTISVPSANGSYRDLFSGAEFMFEEGRLRIGMQAYQVIWLKKQS